jgi:hypothetical protein
VVFCSPIISPVVLDVGDITASEMRDGTSPSLPLSCLNSTVLGLLHISNSSLPRYVLEFFPDWIKGLMEMMKIVKIQAAVVMDDLLQVPPPDPHRDDIS